MLAVVAVAVVCLQATYLSLVEMELLVAVTEQALVRVLGTHQQPE
tara:strand:+ start:643 stop:777 length:135 start_codon:yes stop_codon:yes gene_type:complete